MKKILTIKHLLLLIFLTFFLTTLSAAESPDTIKPRHPFAYNGYQGGMMLHIGYVRSNEFQMTDLNNQPIGVPYSLNGTSLGIGGAIRIGFGKHLRIGMEGYVTTHKYGPNASSAKVGWGGLLLDSHWHINRWTIFTGGIIGGGSYTHLTFIDVDPNTPAGNYPNDYIVENQYTSYRYYPFLVIDPFIGVEYNITKRISLVAKIDYMLNVTNWADDFSTGPRFFFGFMFGR